MEAFVSGNPVAQDEVAQLCSDLIRIDTTNPGDHSGPGERAAAEYVAGKLAEVGLEPQIFESHSKRANLVARIEGTDPARSALLMHGHLDVVLAFLADEEAGGAWGARWLVDSHPGLFDGCTEAVGEVGGFSYTLHGPSGPQRFYLLQTAEKGMAWLRLTARGKAGHGSMLNDDNAVTELAEAVARLGRHEFGVRLTPTVQAFLEQAAQVLEIEFSPEHCQEILDKLGLISRITGATLRNTTNPTMLRAGYKVNVIPQVATAEVDGRFLPGYEDDFLAELDQVLGPRIQREFVHRDVALETTFDGPLVGAMIDALSTEDPAARVVPYCLSGGTDAKSFARLGIRCFGFTPLQLPSDLDFSGMFHGIDERVPVDALRFGVRVLDEFLDHC